jgi:GNAT superfamily N-acetyltransferase
MNTPSIPLFQGGRWTARRVSEADIPAIEDLLTSGRDFLELVSGSVEIAAETKAFLSELPLGKTIADKYSLGIAEESDRLVGILDAIRDYPDPGIWWIGLLLLRPEARGRGLGAQILDGFSDIAGRCGAHEMRLGVVETNPAGLRFWQRMGFTEISRRPPVRFGEREQIVIVMRKGLRA